MSPAAFELAMIIKPMPPLEPTCGSCLTGSSECKGPPPNFEVGHTNDHIPDIMVGLRNQWGKGPAKNVRSFGMFHKFLTTCATVYEVLPAIYSLVLTQHSRHEYHARPTR